MLSLDLTKLPWQLRGWRPHAWRQADTLPCDVPPLSATVPGSVQANLRRAGILPDWTVGFRSLECEWVEHRHWEFFVDLDVPAEAGPFVLHADGLDYGGWVLVDGREAATFRGTLRRHRLELTGIFARDSRYPFSDALGTLPQTFSIGDSESNGDAKNLLTFPKTF